MNNQIQHIIINTQSHTILDMFTDHLGMVEYNQLVRNNKAGQYALISRQTFATPADVTAYDAHLEAAGLNYHYDDDPATIQWSDWPEHDLPVELFDLISDNHAAMWAAFGADLWNHIEMELAE